MRIGLVVALILAIASSWLLSSRSSQAQQPHVTITISGPDVVYPGQLAKFGVEVNVERGSSDFYLTWAETCCEFVNAAQVGGPLEVIGSGPSSVRLNAGPESSFVLSLRIRDDYRAGDVLIGAYLPGTEVAQYETIRSWTSTVAPWPFPRGGGPPESRSSAAAAVLVIAGLTILLASGSCIAAALRRSRP
jgi:hypothetical protein